MNAASEVEAAKNTATRDLKQVIGGFWLAGMALFCTGFIALVMIGILLVLGNHSPRVAFFCSALFSLFACLCWAIGEALYTGYNHHRAAADEIEFGQWLWALAVLALIMTIFSLSLAVF